MKKNPHKIYIWRFEFKVTVIEKKKKKREKEKCYLGFQVSHWMNIFFSKRLSPVKNWIYKLVNNILYFSIKQNSSSRTQTKKPKKKKNLKIEYNIFYIFLHKAKQKI